jgi:6-phosphogluconolactonase
MTHPTAALNVFADSQELARGAAEHFIAQASQAIARGGRFSVALSGGTTPKQLYALLASPPLATAVDWGRTHVFWSDERCVPPDHPQSNYAMARRLLLESVPILPANIHRMRGEAHPAQAAAEYEQILRDFFAHQGGTFDLQSFDLVLLGMGEDGHTASLFPGSPALQVSDRWVAAVVRGGRENPAQAPLRMTSRLTLTLPAINSAAQVTFLVSGASKSRRLRQVISAASLPDRPCKSPPPARLIHPQRGRLLWLVDKAAASRLGDLAPTTSPDDSRA